ncbi:MAG: NAD-dependent epimerase/dehydratase family protein [Beijerinckiaceae bacterium]
MRVVVFGGDGFCGWPAALHLSDAGHEVMIVDNLVRRRVDAEMRISSLTPIAPVSTRVAAWKELTGREIGFCDFDIARNYHDLAALLENFRPEAVVHLAEQRSVPYAMKSERHKRYTVDNKVTATHNILCAIVESGRDVHVVHIGTMGVYGYATDGGFPEGYLKVEVADKSGGRVQREILYPANPESIYHVTKSLDQQLFQYYNIYEGLRITDLHQGIVWGTNTRETKLDPRVVNRFDYDVDYGTVLNRFLMQAAIGYPLTVYGSGGQTRAFIHVQDTVRCIELALKNPPEHGERVRIFNQMTETYRVIDLANIVSKLTGARVQHLSNPRNEAPQNDLVAAASSLIDLGLNPIRLAKMPLEEVVEIAQKYADRCDWRRIQYDSAATRVGIAASAIKRPQAPAKWLGRVNGF